MKRILAAMVLAVATSAALPALAATWTDPSTGIEWTYRVISGEAEIYSEWRDSRHDNRRGHGAVHAWRLSREAHRELGVLRLHEHHERDNPEQRDAHRQLCIRRLFRHVQRDDPFKCD